MILTAPCIILEDDMQNPSFLPGNDYAAEVAASSSHSPTYQKISPSLSIQNSILAVTNALSTDSHASIRDASVLCYVYVSEVDEAKKRIRLLAPTSGKIPARAMIAGSWPEDVVDLVG